jgi:hypothetical protein
MYICNKVQVTQCTNHPKPLDGDKLPFPTRLLHTPERKDALMTVKSQSSKGVGRNFLKEKLGTYINSMKMQLMSEGRNKSTSQTDDISEMLERFQNSEDISFTAILDLPINEYRRIMAVEEDKPVKNSTTAEDFRILPESISTAETTGDFENSSECIPCFHQA